jgi:hypothetical protein
MTDLTLIVSNDHDYARVIAHTVTAKNYLQDDLWLDLDADNATEIPATCAEELMIDAGYHSLGSAIA